MVQARQIFVFVEAISHGLVPDARTTIADSIDAFIRVYCKTKEFEKGFAFSATASGEIVRADRDAYTHAFVLFALAAAHRLTREQRFLEIAERVDRFVKTSLTDHGNGGLFSSAEAISGSKKQNPLMHLLEAYLALEETEKCGRYLGKASKIVELFESKIYDAAHCALPEEFSPNWSKHPDKSVSETYEPGHQFEWAWLLAQYDSMSGDNHSELIGNLWRSGRTGVSDDGHCFDLVDFNGAAVRRSIRLWPHTEGIRAAALHAAQDPQARETCATMSSALCSTFLGHPFPAGWIDHFDAARAPLVDYVPASSLYHLFGAYKQIKNSLKVRSNGSIR